MRADLQRFIGDDWDWTWSTSDDVSSWSDPVVTIREHRGVDATVLRHVDGWNADDHDDGDELRDR